ncbi:hypothetical protein ACFSKI_13685 [Pseudogracilibacillus auburnensis]|uniref:hypothetical protein n=1 Tax=Pseudogracilibacillus auburnensis TaxID=1494959 RepID=UPI000D756EF9|nr:hypothetical protein [Pseudogracilibacillus auburnensis]
MTVSGLIGTEYIWQHPSIQVFYDLVSLFVDKFFHPIIIQLMALDVDEKMDDFTEKELVLIETLAKGIKKSREMKG